LAATLSTPALPRLPRFVEWFVPLFVVCVGGLWMLRERQYFLVDDAYITFRYAENLVRGHGLVWNAGVPLEGYTSLLWVVLLSGAAALGLGLTVPAVVGSLGFALATVELTRRISRRLDPDAGWLVHLLPGLLLASIPSFCHAATSGMEGTCFGFWVLLAMDRLVRGRSDPRARLHAALWFSLAYLTRPEGAMVAALLFVVEAAQLDGPWRARVRALLPAMSIVGVVIVAQVAVRLAYYGQPLPNTFYAKVIFGKASILRGAAHIAGFVLAGGWLAFPGLFELDRETPPRPLWVHGYVLFGVYLVYLLIVGGDHPFWNRFYMPLLPMPVVATSRVVVRWGASLAARLGRAAAFRGPGGVLASGALAVAVWFSAVPFAEPNMPVVGSVDPSLKQLILAVDRFFREEVPKDSFVAVAAVGYVGYRNLELFILDIWGLNDEHIAHLDVAPTVKFGHDKVDLIYVVTQKPDYIYALFPGVPPPLLGYDVCWPSDYAPAGVYRRNYPLSPGEAHLGVPGARLRHLPPPPPCRPTALAKALFAAAKAAQKP